MKVNKKVCNAKKTAMMMMSMVMTLVKMTLMNRITMVMMMVMIMRKIMMIIMRMMMMKNLPGWGSERVVGTTVKRAIVMKNLKDLIVISQRSSLH